MSKYFKRGGNCSVDPTVSIPCSQTVDTSKFACVNNAISQSDMAFESRFAMGPKMTGGRRQRRRSTKRVSKKMSKRRSPKKMSSKRHSRKARRTSQKAGAYYLNVDIPRIGGLAEVTAVYDELAPMYSPNPATINNRFATPLFLSEQKGGKRLARRSSKKTKKSKKIQRGGVEGLPSVFDPNMLNREFNCYTPEWAPKCT